MRYYRRMSAILFGHNIGNRFGKTLKCVISGFSADGDSSWLLEEFAHLCGRRRERRIIEPALHC